MALVAERPSEATLSLTQQQGYDSVIFALQRLQASKRRKRDLIPKKNTNRTLLEVSLDLEHAQLLTPGTPFGLERLHDTGHYFVQFTSERSPYIPEMKRRLEILNSSGERILIAVEETSCLTNAFSYSSMHDFDYRLIDPNNGLEAFRLSSRSRAGLLNLGGTVISVLKENRQLGTIIQSGEYATTIFKLLSLSGRLMYIIKPEESYVQTIRPSRFQRVFASDDIDIPYPTDFDIYSADESAVVGRIAANWNIHEVEESGSSSDDVSSDEDSVSSGDPDDTEDQSTDSGSVISLPSNHSDTDIVPQAESDVCIPFYFPPVGRPSILEAQIAEAIRRQSQSRRFNPERYERFLRTVSRRVAHWEWYYEVENLGAEFDSGLGSVTRSMIVALLLILYFRMHYDRFHRRKSSRILFKAKFRQWCLISGAFLIVAILVIVVDVVRFGTPS